MRLTLSALLISSMALGGCAAVRDSRVNPFNWFGGSRSEAVATAPTDADATKVLVTWSPPTSDGGSTLDKFEIGWEAPTWNEKAWLKRSFVMLSRHPALVFETEKKKLN